MNNWCVLFFKTGIEDKIVEKLKSSVDESLVLPFTITKERYIRKAGNFLVERNRCFPGYLFIQTDLLAEDLLVLTRESVKKTKDIYRFLTYDGKNSIFIHDGLKPTIYNSMGPVKMDYNYDGKNIITFYLDENSKDYNTYLIAIGNGSVESSKQK
jgi:hypothetical protein